ncbi:MAG: PfkB family carbohydrate kinase [Oscillospiraceae bacterium]|nr:PfkB family carbohydrate kinase [Oscillospiraceae bacterium]
MTICYSTWYDNICQWRRRGRECPAWFSHTAGARPLTGGIAIVITVTLNPAVDVTARLDRLCPGATNRLSESVVNAGGKGVNAARLVKALGGDVIAAGFGDARFIASLTGLEQRFIEVGETRVNMKIIDARGQMTELNSPGAPVGDEAYRAMAGLLLSLAAPGTVFVLAGSLPPDAPAGLYASCIRMLKERGCKTVLDASGEVLRLGVLENPDIVKPNRDEMAYVSRAAYRGFLCHSRGEQGAQFAYGKRKWAVKSLLLQPVSPAGAGDCMTGALAYALDKGLSPEDAALLSVAAAHAAVMTPGTGCPSIELIHHYKELLHESVSSA